MANIKDKPVLDFLTNKFGGNVYLTAKGIAARLMIRDLKSVVNVVNNINGKLRTPKIQRFHETGREVGSLRLVCPVGDR